MEIIVFVVSGGLEHSAGREAWGHLIWAKTQNIKNLLIEGPLSCVLGEDPLEKSKEHQE